MSRAWTPGRDPRAVRHAAAGGRSRLPDDAGPTVVVGGGIAGIAAATGLAERGARVVLVEPEEQLGGRVRAWPLADGRSMSRGFHAFFRQYYNLRALLRRADPALERLVPIEDYPLVLADGPSDSFTGIPRTPPLNLAAFVAKSPSFTLADLARVDAGAAMELLDVSFPQTFSRYDGESAAAFLDRLRFPELARHLALEVFARSFFADPDDFAAGELVAMFHAYFLGSSEGLLFDVPVDDYETSVWGPLRRHLEGLGVDVRTGEAVVGLDLSAPGAATLLLASGELLEAGSVVLAADPTTARRLLLEAGVDDPSWRDRVAAQRLAPPFAVWRLWLDRTADASRPPFLGTSGFGPVDNVSLVERFEEGARAWTAEHGGSVVELHAYALPSGLDDLDEPALRRRMRDELTRAYPELADAQAVHEEWLVRQDCPLAAPTPWLDRLTVETPDPRLVLAGDGVRCDLPVALMERAATTGFLAANALLARHDVRGHDLWSVPMQARNRVSPPLHRLLERAS
ncbi:FAD-dependent oxidoreductase [Microlunatus flavus]|uniref:Isorenieratene synthase n=1 Tax=Microlunatus flavus TaxID=1036181 RepID=A0A1H8ZCN8_9ACTN|nr:FAD-dependent oxidoreductase [Microlunatus flavus]SEP62173.1 isorenieratene synthase [Microlunatus flavus]